MPRIGKMPCHVRGRAKRILYTLHKRGTSQLSDLTFASDKFEREKKPEKDMAQHILRRLIKKGLVTSDKVSVRGRGSVSRAYYWLTDEGVKVADEIAKQVNEHKSW